MKIRLTLFVIAGAAVLTSAVAGTIKYRTHREQQRQVKAILAMEAEQEQIDKEELAKKKDQAARKVADAAKRMGDARLLLIGERLDAFHNLVAAWREAEGLSVPTVVDKYRALITEAVENDRAYEQKAKTSELPAVPEKPVYENPEYSGVFHLTGAYRGRFVKGGIVVQRGSKYYVVENADPPVTPFVSGYVETVGMELLDIGDGRFADAVRLSDRQAYEEDQRAYREEVASAKEEYQRAIKEYEVAVKRRREAEAAATRASEDPAVAQLRFRRDQQIITLARNLAELHLSTSGQ